MKCWFVPIYDNGTTGKGSDSAHMCSYVRRDCVRKFIQGIVDRKVDGHKVKELYSITEQEFWKLDWYNIDVLRKYGKCLYSEDRGILV